MPLQIKRLMLAFAVFIGLMLGLKYFLTPDSWREYGPYRGKALTEIADKVPKYVDMETCAMCHDSIAELKNQGLHKLIQCELCHGPGYLHVEDDENNKMKIPEGSGVCIECHAKNAARPDKIIKQVDVAEHSEGEECINCHNPHEPWL
ncbi:MAG: hypothetical protein L3J66_07655 [Bacteroidales bacterium]|nr:hypothetical protein [Bacteroidales bacterium]